MSSDSEGIRRCDMVVGVPVSVTVIGFPDALWQCTSMVARLLFTKQLAMTY